MRYQSARGEKSVVAQNKKPRGILRAKAALRMTVFGFFAQSVKPRRANPTKLSAKC
jgi:hypothetical protein